MPVTMINPIRFIRETITGIIGADGAVVSLTFCGKKIETIMSGSKKCDSWVGTRQGPEFIGGYYRGFRFLAPRRGPVPHLARDDPRRPLGVPSSTLAAGSRAARCAVARPPPRARSGHR